MTEKLGDTGRYPRGKLNDDDEGEIRIRIVGFIQDGKPTVLLEFGKEVKWLAFAPEHAKDLATALTAAASVVQAQSEGAEGPWPEGGKPPN